MWRARWGVDQSWKRGEHACTVYVHMLGWFFLSTLCERACVFVWTHSAHPHAVGGDVAAIRASDNANMCLPSSRQQHFRADPYVWYLLGSSADDRGQIKRQPVSESPSQAVSHRPVFYSTQADGDKIGTCTYTHTDRERRRSMKRLIRSIHWLRIRRRKY